MKDVARDARVSTATVSHVVNGTRYVSPGLVKRVLKSMTRLDYHPDQVARSLRTQRTSSLGLIVSDISNPFFSALARGAEDAAAELGYSVVISNTDESPEKERSSINVLRQRRCDGLVIAPTANASQDLSRLVSSGVPCVLVDRRIAGIEVSAILSQDVEGAYTATQHLIEYGHTRIGIILGLEGVSTCEERYHGYQLALRDAGLVEDKTLSVRGDLRISGGIRCCNELLNLQEPPTAIFSLNNLSALGVLCAIRERGLRFPEDISVISFGCPWWLDRVLTPSLTYVEQAPYTIGQIAMKRLAEHIEFASKGAELPVPEEVRVHTELRIGQSVLRLPVPERSGEETRMRHRR